MGITKQKEKREQKKRKKKRQQDEKRVEKQEEHFVKYKAVHAKADKYPPFVPRIAITAKPWFSDQRLSRIIQEGRMGTAFQKKKFIPPDDYESYTKKEKRAFKDKLRAERAEEERRRVQIVHRGQWWLGCDRHGRKHDKPINVYTTDVWSEQEIHGVVVYCEMDPEEKERDFRRASKLIYHINDVRSENGDDTFFMIIYPGMGKWLDIEFEKQFRDIWPRPVFYTGHTLGKLERDSYKHLKQQLTRNFIVFAKRLHEVYRPRDDSSSSVDDIDEDHVALELQRLEFIKLKQKEEDEKEQKRLALY